MPSKFKITAWIIVLLCVCIYGKTVYAQDTNDSESHIITGFEQNAVPVDEITVSSKYVQEKMIEKMPKSLPVYLDGETTLTSIPVTWYCIEEDYETSEDYYFQFNPKWDSEKYQLADNLDALADSPYVAVFIQPIRTFSATSNIEEIFNFMVGEMNLNSAAACGILANIEKESDFNPKATGDYSTSYGICQWHADRKTSLQNWCSSNGYNYQTLTGQLHYLQYELSSNNYRYLWNGKTIYNNVSSVNNSAQGAYDSGYYWCYYYEVPASKASVSVTRGNLARNTYWPKYGNKISKSSVSSSESFYTTGSNVTLTYTNVSTAKSYTLSLYQNGKEVKTQEVSGNKVTLKSLQKGSYKAYIIADIGDENLKSSACEFSVIDRPATPVLKGIKNSDSGVTISWNAVKDIDGYYVYRKSGNGAYKKIATIKDNTVISYTDTKASGGTTYTYTVRAYKYTILSDYDKNGKSILYLSRPKISKGNTPSGITLQWKKISGSKGYCIDRKTGNGKWVNAVKKTTALTWTDKNVKNGTQYTYRIRAYNGTTYSAYSPSNTATRLKTLSIKSLSNSSKKTMKVCWSQNSQASAYQIQYATSSSFSNAKKKTITSYKTLNKSISSLTKGRKYYVRVRCYKTINGKKYYSGWSSVKYVTIRK